MKGPTGGTGGDRTELYSCITSFFFCLRFHFQRKQHPVGSDLGHMTPFDMGRETPGCKSHPTFTGLHPMGTQAASPQAKSEEMDNWEIYFLTFKYIKIKIEKNHLKLFKRENRSSREVR